MANLLSVKSDMLLGPFLENLFIYIENLSFFYLICVSVSFLAVWFTWNIESTSNTVGSKEELVKKQTFFLKEKETIFQGSHKSM